MNGGWSFNSSYLFIQVSILMDVLQIASVCLVPRGSNYLKIPYSAAD